MSTLAPNAYLRNAVMTAAPEQLQLMLYDGALRFTRQGQVALEAKDFEGVFNALSRAQKIVLELQSGLRRDVDPALCDRMSQIYTFIYRRLVDSSIHHDADALAEVIKLLEYQRETWVLLLDKIEAERPDEPAQPAYEDGSGGALCVEG